MKSPRSVRPLVILLASAFSVAAHAVPITYEFSGRVDWMSYGNPAPPPFGGLSPLGETASGSFTFDTDLMHDGGSTDPLRLFLQPSSADFASFGISVSNFAPLSSFASAGNCVEPYSYLVVSDNNPNAGYPAPEGVPSDQWKLSVRCTQQIAPGVEELRSLYFELNDWNPALTPDLMNGMDPTQLLDLALASTNFVSFGYVRTDASCTTCSYGVVDTWNLGVDLASLTRVPTNVPEPATAMLLMAGLTGCLLGRRRRSQPARSPARM